MPEHSINYRFPALHEVPRGLLSLDGNCGPVSAWLLLRHFGRRTSVERLIRLCRYTKRHGTFTIAIALALREHGLVVSFHTDPDPRPKPLERQLYKTARGRGLVMGEALEVEQLIFHIAGKCAIVLIDTDEREGHFTPVIGMRRKRLVLPNTVRGEMNRAEFKKRWSAPEICRQCGLVAR